MNPVIISIVPGTATPGGGWPGFEAVGKAGGRAIVPDAGEIRKILARQPQLKPMSFPAGSFPGQSAALHLVGQWSFVLARPGLIHPGVQKYLKETGLLR